MHALNIEQLLDIWEKGLSQSFLQRSFILLTAAFPETDSDDLLKLSIGQRDAHLLQVRKNLFGQDLFNTACCPQCNERMEWQNQVEELLEKANTTASNRTEFELELDGYSLKFRLPNSLDVFAVANLGSLERAQQEIISRCLISALNGESICKLDQLPENVQQNLIKTFENLDPLADIRMDLQCPYCSNCWSVVFDIASYLWFELNDWAEKTLQANFQLALAFGWSEKEIFSLSPYRRQCYLGMLQK